MASCGGSAAPAGPPASTASAATTTTTSVANTTAAGGGARFATAATTKSAAKYGGLPSWLPKPKTRVDRIVSASAARPALAIEGATVSADVNEAHPPSRVLVTAVGPEVPPQVHYPPPRTSPCTFIVTFDAPSAPIPLSASAFTIVDELGTLHHPRVTSMSGGPAPAFATPGRPVSLKLYNVLPTGSGTLRWAPTARRSLVSWDFNVEVD